MKITFIILVSLLVTSGYAQCACSEHTNQTNCNNDDCFWNNGTCQNLTCANLIQDNCTNFGNVFCYWNGTACTTYTSCSDIVTTTATGSSTCPQYGCAYVDGASTCSTSDCSSFLLKTSCNSQQIFVNNAIQFCFFQNDKCVPMPNSTSCNERQTQHQCLFDDSQCGWQDESEDCVDAQCTPATTSALCSSFFVNGGVCQFNSTCTFVQSGLACNQYSTSETCGTADYCSWNSTESACENYSCADAKCSGTTVNAYPSGGPENYIFCQGGEDESCVTAASNSVDEDECNSITNNFYEWNGTSCQQCKVALQVAFGLGLLSAMLAIFA